MSVELDRVLLLDSVHASCREILEAAGISVDVKSGLVQNGTPLHHQGELSKNDSAAHRILNAAALFNLGKPYPISVPLIMPPSLLDVDW